MKKYYNVYAIVEAAVFIGEFEAESKEEAEEKASNAYEGEPSLCYQCSSEVGSDLITTKFDVIEVED